MCPSHFEVKLKKSVQEKVGREKREFKVAFLLLTSSTSKYRPQVPATQAIRVLSFSIR